MSAVAKSWKRMPGTRVPAGIATTSVALRGALTAAALLATFGLICLLASPALAKDGQVTVRAAGTTNESVTVKLSDLGNNDINNRSYRLSSGAVTISGHSLLQVMNQADSELDAIDVPTIPSVTIDRPSGRPITISGDDLRDPGAFPDGPPVFYEDNGATVLVMPGTSATASGSRYRFVFAPVGISIGSAATYEVDLSASRTSIKTRQQVNFTAKVTGQDNGESLSFEWNFNDGKNRGTTTGKVSHRFTRKGRFLVVLDVAGASGSGEAVIWIEVDEAKKKPNDKNKNPDKQPEGNGGQNGGDGGTGDGFGSGVGTFGSGTGGGLPGYLPPTQPSSPVPLPAPTAKPKPEPKPKTPVDDGLTEVRGELVDPVTGETVVPPDQGQAVESADPAPSGTELGGFGIPGEAWAVAGVGLLLGLGGFAELRVFSRLY
jgi:PKD repeat protein